MARELTMVVGVLAEKRKSISRWAADYWVPVAVTPSLGELHEGDIVYEGDGVTRYFLGHCEISCHAAETEAYVHNFNAREPALYVVLRRTVDDEHPLPWFAHCVTASPYLAQDFEDSAEDIIERVVMPDEIEEAIKGFIDAWHKETEFKKRRRDKVRMEEEKFGKEPIFLRRDRPDGGKLDG